MPEHVRRRWNLPGYDIGWVAVARAHERRFAHVYAAREVKSVALIWIQRL